LLAFIRFYKLMASMYKQWVSRVGCTIYILGGEMIL